MKRKNRQHTPLRQRAFTLLEVLVALLVLSIGLLGLASLQVFGLKFGHQSYERTQATLLIYDLADRMRANPWGVRYGYYTGPIPTSAPTPSCESATLTPCSPAQLAADDLYRWSQDVNARLASAGYSIVANPIASPLYLPFYTVTVTWKETGGLPMSQSMSLQLP